MNVTWGELAAVITRDVAPYAEALAAAYNEPHNAARLGNTQAMTAADVVEHYASLPYPFVLLENGVLVGDADLRGVREGEAEFAFLIAVPSSQGKGKGTRFATMIHAFVPAPRARARLCVGDARQRGVVARVREARLCPR